MKKAGRIAIGNNNRHLQNFNSCFGAAFSAVPAGFHFVLSTIIFLIHDNAAFANSSLNSASALADLSLEQLGSVEVTSV